MTEHPVDIGAPPFASIFATAVFKDMLALSGGVAVTLDQCMYGAATRKRTTLAGNLCGLHSLHEKCCHKKHAQRSGGKDMSANAPNQFHSKGTEEYPSELCKSLALLIVTSFIQTDSSKKTLGQRAPPWRGLKSFCRSGRPRCPAPPPNEDVWPVAAALRLCDDFACAGHCRPT